MTTRVDMNLLKQGVFDYMKAYHNNRTNAFETKVIFPTLQQHNIVNGQFSSSAEFGQFLTWAIIPYAETQGYALVHERSHKKHLRFLTNDPSRVERVIRHHIKRTRNSSEVTKRKATAATNWGILPSKHPTVLIAVKVFGGIKRLLK